MTEEPRFLIPGTDLALEEAYDERGALLRLAVGERVHVERRPDGAWRLGDDLATVREIGLPRGLLRRVAAAGRTWTERYLWDAEGRPTEVDGVLVERDAEGRVSACRGPDGTWRYRYGGTGLEVVDGPRGPRRIARGDRGRPVRVREPGGARRAFAYDAGGHRAGTGEDPPGWARDALGRLWTVRGPDGEIAATYLWSGLSCLGRIDGPPDAPLAAAFMLDPTGTPVRVVSAGGVLRIPRDAFGEALLEHPGVPGLYGGPVDGGLVRLPARNLDPRTGSFDRADPLDGLEDDPRRAGGFAGALPVDRDPDGSYAVCRNDPVARADPSGGISALVVPVILSSLTWSSQYHIVNVHFLQLFVNLLPSLVTTDDQGRWSMRRFFSIEGLASRRRGGFGLRFDPVGIENWIKLFAGAARRFTLHHVFWSPKDDEAFDGLEIVRCFEPASAWAPTCYGTLLRAEPARAKRFALRGAANASTAVLTQFPARTAEAWSRAGGEAQPVFPGSRVPWFPAGGLHFAQRANPHDFGDEPGAVGRQGGRIAELAPDGTLAQGTVAAQARLDLPKDGLGLATGRALVITHGADLELHEVARARERNGHTFVRLRSDLRTTATDGLRVRGATVSATTETLPLAAQPDRLDAKSPPSTVRYAREDVLRVAQGATAIGGVRVDRLEVRVTIDAAVGARRLPWELHLAQPSGAARAATKTGPSELEFPAGQDPPGTGDAIAVSGGGATAAFVVTGQAGDRRRTLDRPLPAALADPLTWRPLERARHLGRAAAAPAAPGTALSYAPETSGQAPAAGAIVLIEAGGDVAARTVSSLDADELVLNRALSGAAGTACTVAKVTAGDPDVDRVKVEEVHALTLQPAQDRSGRTLELHQLTAAAVPPFPGALAVLSGAARTGDVAAVPLPPPGGELPRGEAGTEGPTPGQLVVLEPQGAPARPAVVRAVRLEVTLDRRLSFPAAVAAAAAAVPPVPLLAGLEAIPLAPAGPAYVADQLGPRRVLVRPTVGTAAGAQRVEFARPREGDLVELRWTGGPGPRLHRVVHVDGAAITLDHDGGALPANTPDLTVQRLDADDPATGSSRVARNGALRSMTATQSVVVLDVWQPNALMPGTRLAVTDGTTAFPARVAARTRLEVEWHPASVPAGAATVTISVPALRNHPLVAPSAEQEDGEIVLAGQLARLTPGTDLVVAVEYRDERGHADGHFDPGSVLVPEEPTFELSRRESLIDHEMMHTEQSALWGPILLSPFPFRGLEEIIEAASGDPYPPVLHHLGKVYSVGGLMNLVTSSVVSGAAWVIFKLVAFFVRLFSGQPLSFGWLGHADWLSFHDATIPDPAAPTRIRLAAAGEPALSEGDLVEVTAGETYRRATVRAVAGRDVDLDDPAPVGDGLRVALVAEGDETSLVEHAVMRHAGFGALEVPFDIYFDPWSQIAYRGGLQPGSFEDVLFRVARDLFGSSSWTLFPFGYFFWDNALRNRDGRGHLSKMEQSASEESGELYSALGRLDGDLAVVGDVARYWHFIEHRHSTLVRDGHQDAPGIHLEDLLRVMPSVFDNSAAAAVDPNGQLDTAPDGDRPGDQVPDALVVKDAASPGAATLPESNAPRGFAPLARAMVPTSPRVERCCGAYVAFTRPPGPASTRHRLTARNEFGASFYTVLVNAIDAAQTSIEVRHKVLERGGYRAFIGAEIVRVTAVSDTPGADTSTWTVTRGADGSTAAAHVASSFVAVRPDALKSREAQAADRQKLFYDRQVGDVTVTVAGRTVAEGDRVTLVRGQRAAVTATPDGDRRYAAAVLQPDQGPVLRADGALALLAQGTNGVEPVEVARVYSFDPATRSFDHPALNRHGLHLPADLHVPVRRFEVEVVDTVAPRSAPDPAAAPLAAPAHPGDDVYVIVPAPIAAAGALRLAAVTYPGGAPAAVTDPSPTLSAHAPSAAVLPLVAPGVIFRVHFGVADPPEAAAMLELACVVALSDGEADVTSLVALDPHFTLDAGSFAVARGNRLDLTCSGGVTPGAVTVTPAAGVTASTPGGSTVRLDVAAGAAGAPTHTRTVLVTDAADGSRRARRTITVTP